MPEQTDPELKILAVKYDFLDTKIKEQNALFEKELQQKEKNWSEKSEKHRTDVNDQFSEIDDKLQDLQELKVYFRVATILATIFGLTGAGVSIYFLLSFKSVYANIEEAKRNVKDLQGSLLTLQNTIPSGITDLTTLKDKCIADIKVATDGNIKRLNVKVDESVAQIEKSKDAAIRDMNDAKDSILEKTKEDIFTTGSKQLFVFGKIANQQTILAPNGTTTANWDVLVSATKFGFKETPYSPRDDAFLYEYINIEPNGDHSGWKVSIDTITRSGNLGTDDLSNGLYHKDTFPVMYLLLRKFPGK